MVLVLLCVVSYLNFLKGFFLVRSGLQTCGGHWWVSPDFDFLWFLFFEAGVRGEKRLQSRRGGLWACLLAVGLVIFLLLLLRPVASAVFLFE